MLALMQDPWVSRASHSPVFGLRDLLLLLRRLPCRLKLGCSFSDLDDVTFDSGGSEVHDPELISHLTARCNAAYV